MNAPHTRFFLLSVAIALLPLIFVVPPTHAFFGGGYQFCKQLTIDNTLVSGGSDLSDFPVLVSFTDPDLRTAANGGHVENASGYDLIFVDETDTIQLDHEIESYDPVTGAIVMWVRLPVLRFNVDTTFYIYYGNGGVATSQENATGVWSNGYEAVYHLNDDFLDSTTAHDGTNNGSLDIPAQIADGQDFTPVEEIDFGTWSVTGSEITMQAWAFFDDFDQDDPRVVSKALSADAQNHVFMLSLSGAGERYLRMRIKTGTDDATGTTTFIAPSGPLNAGTWYLVAGTYDGSQMTLLLDGSSVGSTGKTGSLRINGWSVYAGNSPGESDTLVYSADAKYDELRISTVARSGAWLTTEYTNHTTQGTGAGMFITSLGTEMDCNPMLVKRAFLPDGTPIPDGSTLPSGTVFTYLIYINNRGGLQTDVSLQDILDPAFAYAGSSLKVDNSVGSCAADDCTPPEEAAIFAAVNAVPAGTDAVDGDVVSFVGGTIHAGNESVANGQLDLAANRVWALLFTVEMQ